MDFPVSSSSYLTWELGSAKAGRGVANVTQKRTHEDEEYEKDERGEDEDENEEELGWWGWGWSEWWER